MKGLGLTPATNKQVEIEQGALYQIASAAISALHLDELYHSIHQVLASIIPAKNFYIALYNEEANLLTFPYFVDQYDEPPPPAPPNHGLTEFVLRTQKPLLATPEIFDELVEAGEVENVGIPSVDWVGIPLMAAEKAVGVMVVQTYEEGIRYGQRELEIMQFVSSQVAMAIQRKQAEESLAASEQRYRTLIEQASDGIFISDMHGNYREVNPSGCAMLGYKREEILQLNIRDLILPEEIQTQPLRMREIKEGKTVIAQRRLRRKDGTRFTAEVSSQLLPDGRVLGVVRDITERIRAEEVRLEEQKKFRSMIENSMDGMALYTADANVLYQSPAVKKILGYEPGEVHGTNVAEFIHPEDADRIGEAYRKVLETASEVVTAEARVRHKDGSYRWLEVSVSNRLNEPGIHALVANYRDITERKETERTLRQSEERFSKAFHSSPIPTCITTLDDGRFLDVNEAYLKLANWKREDVIGQTVEALGIYPDGGRPEFVRKLLNNELVPGEQDTFITSTGETLDAAAFYELIEVGGQTCILSMFYNITEQNRSRELLRASEERLRAIVDHTQNIYYSHTPDHSLTYMSAQVKHILGYEPEEALIKWQEFLTDHPINQRGIQLTQKAIETGLPQDPYVLELKAKGGRHVWVEVRETPVVRDGKTVAVVGALTDISDRKEAEKKLERHVAELTVLHAVAMAGSQSCTEDDVIERTTQIVNGMLFPENCGILLLNHSGNTLKPHPSYRGVADESVIMEFPLSMGITGRVASTGRLARINDVESDPDYIKTTEGVHSELCAPIRVNEKIIGVFNTESRKANAFDEEDERVLITIAGALGTAIERIRLEVQEQRRSKIIEAMADIANVIATTRNAQHALDEIARRSIVLLKARNVAIYLLQKDNETIKVVTAHGSYRGELLSHSIKLGQGITGDIIARGRSEIINDTAKDPRRKVIPGTQEEDNRIETMMSAALILRGKPIGAINAWRLKSEGLFNESELNFLNSIAHQASIAIESGDLYEETVRRAEEAKAIAEVGREISATLQLDIVLKRIATYAKDLLRAETSAVYLAEPNEPILRAVAAIGKDEQEIKADPLTIGTGILGNIAMNMGGEIVNRAPSDPRAIVVKGTDVDPLEHIMGAAVLSKDQLTGLLVVWRTGEGQEFRSVDLDFLTGLANQAAVAIQNAELFENVQKSNLEISQAYDITLEGWGKALELRDKETQGHTERVTELTLRLARKMGLGRDELVQIRRGVLVHDIGKMAIPDDILNKKGPLTRKEWAEMRKHPQHAFDLLYPIRYLRSALDIAYCHHERWDGQGYPRGLKGEQIPLSARIFAIVDVWDALLYRRPYRRAWTRKRTIQYIREQSGAHFDPHIVEVFLKMIEEENKQ